MTRIFLATASLIALSACTTAQITDAVACATAVQGFITKGESTAQAILDAASNPACVGLVVTVTNGVAEATATGKPSAAAIKAPAK